jgi:xylulokinase
MYLGLDLGTSELKALLLADDHRVVAVARAALTVQRPAPLWSEQHPADWWAAVEAVMAELKATQPEALAQLRGIGLSGQMHGAVLLDDDDAVLRPAILWNDGRSGAPCRAWARSPATWRCPASPRRNCCGFARTSRRCSTAPRACCCPRTGCG